MEQEIIAPIPVEVLRQELTPDKQLRMTSRSNNEIYIVTWQDSPNVLREIGRLREIAFRAAGGGTGLDCDLDEFDTMENPYKQLIVWDPEVQKIIGGYRYILGPDIRFDKEGQPILATSHMFHFSDEFIKDYLPYTIELGRSFVTLGIPVNTCRFESYLRSRQPVGRTRSSCSYYAWLQILLRQGDHVSFLQPYGTRYDSVFPAETLSRQTEPRHPDKTTYSGTRQGDIRQDLLLQRLQGRLQGAEP